MRRFIYVFIALVSIVVVYVFAQPPRLNVSQSQQLLSVLKNIEIRNNNQLYVQRSHGWAYVFGEESGESFIELHKVSRDGIWVIIVYHQRQTPQQDSRYDEIPILVNTQTSKVYYAQQLPPNSVLRDLDSQGVTFMSQDKSGVYIPVFESSLEPLRKFYVSHLG